MAGQIAIDGKARCAIAAQVTAKAGDCILNIKGNQGPPLHDETRDQFGFGVRANSTWPVLSRGAGATRGPGAGSEIRA